MIAARILAAVAIVPFSPRLGDITNSDEASFLPASYESAQAEQLARRAFPDRVGASALQVLARDDGRPLTAADGRASGAAARGIATAGIDRVEGVQTGAPGQRSPDGSAGQTSSPRRVSWLASDLSSYVTGTTLHVDAGYTSRWPCS